MFERVTKDLRLRSKMLEYGLIQERLKQTPATLAATRHLPLYSKARRRSLPRSFHSSRVAPMGKRDVQKHFQQWLIDHGLIKEADALEDKDEKTMLAEAKEQGGLPAVDEKKEKPADRRHVFRKEPSAASKFVQQKVHVEDWGAEKSKTIVLSRAERDEALEGGRKKKPPPPPANPPAEEEEDKPSEAKEKEALDSSSSSSSASAPSSSTSSSSSSAATPAPAPKPEDKKEDEKEDDQADEEPEPPLPELKDPAPLFEDAVEVSSPYDNTSDLASALPAATADDRNAYKPKFVLRSHVDGVRALAWHRRDPLLLTSSEDGSAKLWNLAPLVKQDAKEKAAKNVEPVYTYRGHLDIVTSCAIEHTRGLVFTGGADSQIIQWQLPPANFDPYSPMGSNETFRLSTLSSAAASSSSAAAGPAHGDVVWDMLVVDQSGTLVSAGADGLVKLWNIGDKETAFRKDLKYVVKDYVHTPTALALAPTPGKLLVGYSSGAVVCWDLQTGAKVSTFNPANKGSSLVCDLVSHPTLPLAFAACADSSVRFYDCNAAKCFFSLRAHRDCVTSVTLADRSGLVLASASHDSSIRFWDLTSYKLLQDLSEHQTHRKKYDEGIHKIRTHPTLPMLASGGADATVKILV